jgi:GAF domain-containing protein
VADQIIELAQELAEVSRLVEDDDVPSTLDRFVRRVVRVVPDCDEAAIAVLAEGRPDVVARHHASADVLVEPARAALSAQLLQQDGPLHQALQYGEPHRIGDAAADHRWPAFSASMINAGYRSCVLLPLPAKGDSSAAFTIFSATPGAFGDTTYDVVLLFALHAGVAFDNVQLFHDSRSLIEQLQTALSTRTVIAQAEGVLMHRYGIGPKIAFDVLKRGSQNANLKLRDLAADLVKAQEAGVLAAALTRYGLATGRVEG